MLNQGVMQRLERFLIYTALHTLLTEGINNDETLYSCMYQTKNVFCDVIIFAYCTAQEEEALLNLIIRIEKSISTFFSSVSPLIEQYAGSQSLL
jgi:hypothetical protein